MSATKHLPVSPKASKMPTATITSPKTASSTKAKEKTTVTEKPVAKKKSATSNKAEVTTISPEKVSSPSAKSKSPIPQQGKEKQQSTRPSKSTLMTDTELKELQQELLALRAEKNARENSNLALAHAAAKKHKAQNKTKTKTPTPAVTTTNTTEVDDTSLEDSAIDYTLEDNYSVRRFVSHKITLSDKGPPVILLQATWKGYPASEKPTEEPWGLMKKNHIRQLKRYVKRNENLRKVVDTYQLFNELKKTTREKK